MASGALADGGNRWVAGGSKFLFPVRALSKVFRAKYLDGLARLIERNSIQLPPHLSGADRSGLRRRWLRRLRRKPWVVYSKPPFSTVSPDRRNLPTPSTASSRQIRPNSRLNWFLPPASQRTATQ